MATRCHAVRAHEALPALAAAVARAKGASPLAPVTVIVPTNAVGVTARRWLGAHGGIAAIELLTLGRLAERLAGAALAATGRRPVSTPLIDITVRSVLTDAPGSYAAVAEHPATVTTLRDLYREVRAAGPEALDALAAGSNRAQEAARVCRAIAERLATDWYDEADLLTLATSRVASETAPFERAVAFLPRADGLAARLLATVGREAELDVLLDVTGVATVDADQIALAVGLGDPIDLGGASHDVGAATGPTPNPVIEVVSTTDADEEVREATRRVVDAARLGTPFARMSVVWPVDRPYARLIEHHFDVAGVPWNGRPGTLVTERLVPRFLLDLLQIDRRGIRRNELFELLADVPVRGPDGERVSVGQWERLARAAGVTRDDHWEPRLERLAADLRARQTPRERDARAAEQLASFVSQLRRDLGSATTRRTWADWAEWCERQVGVRLGRVTLAQLDEAERLASDHATRVLDRLRHLDAIGGPVTRDEFRAAFAAEFEVAPGRLGRLGDGVTIGSLSGTTGLDADLTIILGAAEGLLPPRPLAHPLISDDDRATAGLADADARTNRLHRSFLAHLDTSPQVVLSVPRGDLRATSEYLPSRWIASHARDAAERVVASHHAGLITCQFPSVAAEHRLRRLAAGSSHDRNQLATEGDAVLRRGVAMRAARATDLLTAYDGDLSGIEIDHFTRPISPSQIESWMACPHAYFVKYLLGVRALEDADEQLALSPLERGNVVHDTLDRFHHRVIDGTLPQPDTAGWTAEHVAALEEIFDEVAGEFERSGRVGRAAHWFLDRRSVHTELINWFAHDGELAKARRSQVLRSEWPFGWDEPVELPMADGRSLAVAGFADRIDRTTSGRLVITDHKTGKAKDYRDINAADPTEGATRFQLPVYAAAALAALGERPGATTTEVLAEYGFFGKGDYQRFGYTFDADVWARVADDLQFVVDAIESGLYPAVTGPPQFEFYVRCHYCQPDGLGVAERYDEWSRKQRDPRITRWFPVDGVDGDIDDADDDRVGSAATAGGSR